MKVRIRIRRSSRVGAIDRWWRENRPAAATLFARELAEARRVLAKTPDLGSPYVERQGVVVRRLLLRKSQNHVYYEIDRVNGIVMIVALWGAPKGGAPKL